jgi:hypothetical protein
VYCVLFPSELLDYVLKKLLLPTFWDQNIQICWDVKICCGTTIHDISVNRIIFIFRDKHSENNSCPKISLCTISDAVLIGNNSLVLKQKAANQQQICENHKKKERN